VTPRGMAAAVVDATVDSCLDARPGMVFVIVVNERPVLEIDGVAGLLEIDACVRCCQAVTERGGMMIVEFAHRLRAAIGEIGRAMASEGGMSVVDRDDLALHVAGPRPKA